MEFNNTCVVCHGAGTRRNGMRCGVCDGHGYIRPVSNFTFVKMLFCLAGLIAICGVCGYYVLGGDPIKGGGPATGAVATPPVRYEREPPPPPGSAEGEMSLLATGHCYRIGSELYLVRRVLCTERHDGEVLAKAPMTPDEQLTDERLDEICRPLFSAAVRARLDRAELRPNNMWDVPHDEAVCTARSGAGGPLVGHLS
jgi:hypothetical protein